MNYYLKGVTFLDFKRGRVAKIRGNEISMIFQDPMTSLDPTMRIGKQIAEPLLKHNKGMSKADAMKRALELMQQVGIPDAEVHINDYPHQCQAGCVNVQLSRLHWLLTLNLDCR